MEKIKNLEGEIWKPIPGFEGYYEVSNKGRVKSLQRPFVKQERLLKQHYCKSNKYPYVMLHGKNSVKKTYRIHVLVMMGFTDYVPQGYNKYRQIDHVNGNPSDNRLENLEIVTQSENMKRAYQNGLEKPIREKVIRLDDMKVYDSVAEAAEDNNFYSSYISRVCKGERKQCKGRHFAYYKDYINGTIPTFKGKNTKRSSEPLWVK